MRVDFGGMILKYSYLLSIPLLFSFSCLACLMGGLELKRIIVTNVS